MPPTRRSSAPPARHKPRLVSRADLARFTGKARSTVTEACQGPLARACHGKRVDAADPIVLRWAGVKSYAELSKGTTTKRARETTAAAVPTLVLRETAPSLTAFAAKIGRPVAEVERDLAAALIPEHHLAANTFAMLAACPVADVVRAAAGELAAAVTAGGRLDASSGAALAWFAGHPFTRDADGEPETEGFPLANACDGDLIDANHWLAAIFFARCGAEVPA